jgi:E3 Ubiquitin ligase
VLTIFSLFSTRLGEGAYRFFFAMTAIIIGIILAAIGGFLIYNRQFALNKAMNVRYHQTSLIRDELEIYKSVAEGVGKGNYSGKVVEFKGICLANNPLQAEHSGTPCVYYEASVTRRYETTEQERDSDGNYRTVTRTHTQTLSSNTRSLKFYLNDGSGEDIMVDPEGASIDSIETFDRFEYEPPMGFNIGSFLANSRTLGFQYTERCIPVKSQLYVLGELSDRRGEVSVVKPSKQGENYIISTKSEEQIVADAQSSAGWQLWGGIALIVGGLITTILGFVMK